VPIIDPPYHFRVGMLTPRLRCDNSVTQSLRAWSHPTYNQHQQQHFFRLAPQHVFTGLGIGIGVITRFPLKTNYLTNLRRSMSCLHTTMYPVVNSVSSS